MFNGSKTHKHFLPLSVINTLLAALGVLALSFVVFSPNIPHNVNLDKGELSPITVVSPRFVEYESEKDQAETAKLQKQRASLVAPIYSIDETINKSIKSKTVGFFTQARLYRAQILQDSNTPIPTSLKFIQSSKWDAIVLLDDKTFSSIEYFTLQITDSLLVAGVKRVRKKTIQRAVKKNLTKLDLEQSVESFISDVIRQFIRPNFVYSEAKTKQLIEEEMAAIQPFTTSYKKGQPVIYKGETVTNIHIEALKQLNLYGVRANLIKYFGIFIYGCLLFILFERFLYYFSPKLHQRTAYYVVIFIIMSIVIVSARLLLEVQEIKYIGNLQFLIPIPIVAMIISLLITPNIAMISGTIVSIFIGLMYMGDFYLLVYLFFSSCVATFATYKMFRRTDLVKAGYVVGLVNIIVMIATGLLLEVNDIWWYGGNALVAFGNGLLSSMVSLALLPYLESTFQITTSLSLLEQTGLNHPLIKRLLITAPGTYQHSLMVANLAEAAAEAIDADVIQTRIGAYFHDIGKMKRPSFFTENQMSGENPHDVLSPRMSKIIISAHAKDGVELAQKYKLPKVLQDFILQHHGTTLVSFFYSQAKAEENLDDSESTKEEFRYPGPKPQFKESGILMLADSVEAAVRSMDKPTLPKIENLIDKIFYDKINDKQLSECNLSLKEIETIRQTFLKLFHGIYHTRLDYQEEIADIINQTKAKQNPS
ncbi:HDIG domain-containing protein [bacterium]|jgi:cyclic-di-AMP phosphodiesterase PgpH|nr:HDIG domain-containing protein [bacterium]